jgi:hypothetical protein
MEELDELALDYVAPNLRPGRASQLSPALTSDISNVRPLGSPASKHRGLNLVRQESQEDLQSERSQDGDLVPMAEKAPAPNPDEKLVRVFDTEQDAEAMVVRSLLESAGIDCNVVGENPPDVLPVGARSILVREEDLTRARQLLAEYERSPEQESADNEVESEQAPEEPEPQA